MADLDTVAVDKNPSPRMDPEVLDAVIHRAYLLGAEHPSVAGQMRFANEIAALHEGGAFTTPLGKKLVVAVYETAVKVAKRYAGTTGVVESPESPQSPAGAGSSPLRAPERVKGESRRDYAQRWWEMYDAWRAACDA